MASRGIIICRTEHICRPLIFMKNYLNCFFSSNKSSIEIDSSFDNVLETFTKGILQRRIDSWESNSKRCQLQKKLLSDEVLDPEFSKMPKEEICKSFTTAFQDCDDSRILKLTKECLKCSICPSQQIVLQILDVCAQYGELQIIRDLNILCQSKKIFFSANMDFSLYEAYAIWINGNVVKALEIYENLYIKNPFLRRHIRVSLKKLMAHVEKNHSEAILIQIIKFSENIVCRYKDYFSLICIWEVCFMSEWFSDQQKALEMIQSDRRLAEVLVNRLPYILSISLRQHRLEAVYRLLEILLNSELHEHCIIVIMPLLDYQFLQGNLRNYSEIIKWCQCNQVSLPRVYNEKYLQLLVNKQDGKNAKVENKNSDIKLIF